MTAPPPPATRVVRLPLVLISVAVAAMVGAGGCLGLILLTAKEAKEQRDAHAITRAQDGALKSKSAR